MGLSIAKNRENFEFLVKIFPKGQTSLSNFYKIKGGRGCPRFVTSRQISPLSLLKRGLSAPKIAKTGNFWYKFAQKGYTPVSDFKFGLEDGLPGLHPHAKLYRCGFMWTYVSTSTFRQSLKTHLFSAYQHV